MFTRNNIILITACVVWVLIVLSCANPVAPTGGPKDVKPPEVVGAVPQNQSISFREQKIELTFDEYVNLSKPNEQVIISPPFLKDPDYRLRGKNLIIGFDEVLKEQTTYSIFFGNAIADITENNALDNFRYVFSTGNTIDSMQIAGRVLSAFTQEPEPDVWVMLYREDVDSLPYFERPYYVTRSDAEGNFLLSYLQDMAYKAFVLKDVNSDYLYDQPNEQIAFSDTLIPAWPAISIVIDSAANAAPSHASLTFHMFQEVDSVQHIIDTKMIDSTAVQLVFRFPLYEPVITSVTSGLPEPWKMEERGRRNDSILLWLLPGTPDTIVFTVSDRIGFVDTVQVDKKRAERFRKSQKPSRQVAALTLTPNTSKGGALPVHKPLILTASRPIKEYDLSAFLLFTETDTVQPQVTFADSSQRKLIINMKWKPDLVYQLFLPDSVFFDWWGAGNDTLRIKFSTTSPEDYGNLHMNLNPADTMQKYILELMTEDNKVITQRYFSENINQDFINLSPGKYKIRIIFDQNCNGRWDTGAYLLHLQPERIIYFSKPLEIRANWITEEKWDF